MPRKCATIWQVDYPADKKIVSYEDGLWKIRFSEADTRKFKGKFWLDAHIHLVGGEIPQTDIVELEMAPTLVNKSNESSD